MNHYNLNNKVAIVRGASRGIGKNLAQSFFNHKSNLFLISRNEEKLKVDSFAPINILWIVCLDFIPLYNFIKLII